MNDPRIKELCDYYNSIKSDIDCHLCGVEKYFLTRNDLISGNLPAIHSVKKRIKDNDHLVDKIRRKEQEKGIIITKENLLKEITDLAGIRILHLYNEQFSLIHTNVMEAIKCKRFALGESVKAYSWDPEYSDFFKKLKIKVQIKPSHYTSVHYLIKPNKKSDIVCELQVRNLFEEIWGELDHFINYPHESSNDHCKEQLRVLAKLVATGTRLATSIIKSHAAGTN